MKASMILTLSYLVSLNWLLFSNDHTWKRHDEEEFSQTCLEERPLVFATCQPEIEQWVRSRRLKIGHDCLLLQGAEE